MTRFHFSASLDAPLGRELWLVGGGPGGTEAAGLGGSLAARGLSRVLVEAGEAGEERMRVAEAAARGAGAELVAAALPDLEPALREAAKVEGPGLALIASEEFVRALLERALQLRPGHPSPLSLVPGRATCLRMGSGGWLLAHHNVRDPGTLRQGPEGLGRPS